MSTTWCLVRMVSKVPGPQGHNSLAYVRELQEGEKEQVDKAQRMMRSFASTQWAWNKIGRAYQDLLTAIDAAIQSTERASGHFSNNERLILSRTVIETARVIVSWPADVLEGSSDHAGTDDVSRQRITEIATTLTQDATLSTLQKIVDAQDDAVAGLTSHNGSFVAYLEKSSLESAGVTSPQNWLIGNVFSIALAKVEQLAAVTLTSYRKEIEDAARLIHRIHADVVYGTPAIIPRQNLEKLSSGSGGDLQILPIEAPNIEGVLRAADTAEAMLAGRIARNQFPGSSPAPGAADSGATTDTREDQSEQSSEYAPRASSLSGLLRYASGLTTQAEAVWSATLDIQGDDANKETLTRWYSFLASLQGQFNERIRTQGDSQDTIARFPVDAGFFKSEWDSAGSQNSLLLANIAEIYAVQNLVQSLKGLQQPTLSSIDLITGEERTWWDSGAFSTTKRVAETTLRMTERREYLAALEDSDQTADSAPEPVGGNGLLLANLALDCLRQGRYEACILYFSLSVRNIASKGEEKQSNENVVARVVQLRGAQMEDPTRRLLESIKELSCSAAVNLEEAIVLAHFWADEIDRLVRAIFEDASRTAAKRSNEGDE
ncbi:hypothetical protein ABZ957_12935 [Streptomyces sp. NPDC046316]|uniref:hypothetical protein n=1 Tax=Streptomyces sp. NPDC046316 TaxID=3154494 RepID=UPI0033FC0B0C